MSPGAPGWVVCLLLRLVTAEGLNVTLASLPPAQSSRLRTLELCGLGTSLLSFSWMSIFLWAKYISGYTSSEQVPGRLTFLFNPFFGLKKKFFFLHFSVIIFSRA